MKDLLKMLGVDKLDESQQENIKEKIETIIDLKASEKLEKKLTEEKNQLIESYEEKFEEYKDDITSKFSNFVDSVLDEELVIPDKIMEYAKKGELYNDLIEQFKVRLSIDENLIDKEVKDLLKEAKEEIIKIREEMNEMISENLEIKTDAQQLAAELYLRKKSDGLTESQKKKVFAVLEGVLSKDEIDKKFDIIIESLNEQYDKEEEEDEEEENKDKKKKDEDEEEEETNEGKGHAGAKEDDNLNENDSPFDTYIKSYVKTLRENKI
jgi:hypothetical protein